MKRRVLTLNQIMRIQNIPKIQLYLDQSLDIKKLDTLKDLCTKNKIKIIYNYPKSSVGIEMLIIC